MLPALRAGLGIALLPDFIVGDDLAAGALDRDPRPTGARRRSALHLLTPPGTLRPARVEALIDFLAERLRSLCGDAVSDSELRESLRVLDS